MLPPSRSATREPLAATQTADIRALLGAGDEDRVAVAHFLVGALFLVLAGVFQLIALFSLRFAGLSPISYGRAESMANITVMLGFLVLTLAGGIYYVLPRLTGARLWRKELAYLGLLGVSGLVVLDLLAVAFGLGEGRQPFGLPWWLHLPMLAVLTIPFAVTMMTIRRREEERSFVTLWFVMGGVAWLPLLYLAYSAGSLPFVGSLGADVLRPLLLGRIRHPLGVHRGQRALLLHPGQGARHPPRLPSAGFSRLLVTRLRRRMVGLGATRLWPRAGLDRRRVGRLGPGLPHRRPRQCRQRLAHPPGALGGVEGQAGCHLWHRRPLPGGGSGHPGQFCRLPLRRIGDRTHRLLGSDRIRGSVRRRRAARRRRRLRGVAPDVGPRAGHTWIVPGPSIGGPSSGWAVSG